MKMESNRQATMDKLRKLAKQAVYASAIELQDRIQAKLNLHNSSLTSGGIPSAPGMPPGNRTGALMRSIQVIDSTIDPNKPRYRVGTKIVYARIQEFGGRISAKHGKYLTIPLGTEGRRAAKRANGDIRSLALSIIPRKGKLFLAKVSKTGIIKFLFILKKFVYLPARPYFRPAIAEHKAAMKKEFKIGGVVS